MEAIDRAAVQEYINKFQDKEIYYHLETSTGSYASLQNEKAKTICAFVRNSTLTFHRGTIVGEGPYKVGLKLNDGWLYAEGLTDWEVNASGQLLMAGYDEEGMVNIALELSHHPFTEAPAI